LVLPDQSGVAGKVLFDLFGLQLTGGTILWIGMAVCVLGVIYGLIELRYLRRLPAHASMLAVSALIYRTCGRICCSRRRCWRCWSAHRGSHGVLFYFLEHMEAGRVAIILACRWWAWRDRSGVVVRGGDQQRGEQPDVVCVAAGPGAAAVGDSDAFGDEHRGCY